MSGLPRKQHQLSAAFPSMSPVELAALTDDIAAHGLRQPIVTLDGQILDGWHRYQACVAARVEPVFVDFDGDNPIAFVLSHNAHRRHLTAAQRASAAVACSEWKPQGQQAVESKPAPGAGLSEKALAQAADVSVRSIQQAKAAERVGLGPAVRAGKVSAKKAAAIAALPDKERAAAVADPEGWQERLERKPTNPKGDQLRQEPTPEQEAALDDAHERMADLAADYEAALKIIEADDKLGEAWGEVKTLTLKLAELDRLYAAKCDELATMTKEAKRWRRKAEALEKGRAA